MKNRRFPYWAVLLPSILVGSFEFARHTFFERVLPRTWGNIGAAILVGAASALYIGLAFRYIRQVERHASRVREEAALLQERDRIARDLHDNISQTIFYMAVRLDELASSEHLEAAVAELKGDLQEADAKIRRTIADLRRRRAPRTLGGALKVAADEVGRAFRVRVDLTVSQPDLRLGEAALEQVSGIVQEALINAAKYAGVDRVAVGATIRKDGLYLSIVDNGRGFDPLMTPAGFGLQMMQERAEMLGAAFQLKAAPGEGVRVEVIAPLGAPGPEGGDRG